MSQIARSYKEGIRPPALDSAGGVQEGQIVIQTTVAASGDPQVILPTGTAPQLTAPYGVSEMSGFVGGSGSVAGEAAVIKRQGLTRVLLSALNAIVAGQEFQADPAVLGQVIPRVPYTMSGWTIGTFEEAFGSNALAKLVEAYIQPVFKELVRPISVSQPLKTTVLGAATVFGSGLGLAFSAAAVGLYRVRTAGEVIRNLSVSVAIAPGGVDTVIAAVVKSSDNGNTYTAPANGPTCTITGAAFSASDLVNTYVAAAGDIIGIRFISSAGTAAGTMATVDAT